MIISPLTWGFLFLSVICISVRGQSAVSDIIATAIQNAIGTLNGMMVANRNALNQGVDFVTDSVAAAGRAAFGAPPPVGPASSPASAMRQQAQFGRPDNPVPDQIRSNQAAIAQMATVEIASRTGSSVSALQASPSVASDFQRQITAAICEPRQVICNPLAPFRNTDGTCNNLQQPFFGASNIPQARILPPAYDDGIMSPRIRSAGGGFLPSARAVSNAIHDIGTSFFGSNLSPMFTHYGQFIDHDLTFSPTERGENGSAINCCSNNDQRMECFPIPIPVGDPRFVGCMNLVRTLSVPPVDCSISPRNQVNQRTSFVDGSAIYGNTFEQEQGLRNLMSRGLMATSGNHLLPELPEDLIEFNECILEPGAPYCFDAGDHRNTETPVLTVIHTVWVREHNRIAFGLGNLNPHWSDERVFQEAKKLTIGELQHVTYAEFLSRVLNGATQTAFNLRSTPFGFNTVYNPFINPTMFNAFGVAAYRFGHSLVRSIMSHVNDNYEVVNTFDTARTFNRPLTIFQPNQLGVENFARWMSIDTKERADRFITDALRNNLFLDANNNAFDLAALNIQRGRDHGVPSYNAYREFCGRPRAFHFGTGFFGLRDHDPQAAAALRRTYSNINDIDLFAGALSEIPLPGALVGPTFSCLIGLHFRNAKLGDRFWYENNFARTGFTEAQLNSIKSTTFRDILCRNLRTTRLTRNPFEVFSRTENPLLPCQPGRQPALHLWRDVSRKIY